MLKRTVCFGLGLFSIIGVGGCTVHPKGEQEERHAALEAGKPFQRPIEQRSAPTLPENPTADDLVRYALLTNADLEKQYWEWCSAIEQIPQDGSQATNLAISGGTIISDGSLSRERTSLSAMNDPMQNIVLPEKLSVAAKRALANAHAVGLRFQKEKFAVRKKVLDAYYDYALTAELIRLEEANAALLQTTVTSTEARNRAGAVGQVDVIKARNELDLSRNDLANLKSQLPSQLAMLNALLNRESTASLPPPAHLPTTQPISATDDQLLELAAKQNPELNALASEVESKHGDIRLAKLQYTPDFSVNIGTDLAGVAQTLSGMVTIPALRHEAIAAAVAEAEANLRAVEASRRQTRNDLAAQMITDLTTLRDADRQFNLFRTAILPRTRQIVGLARSSYETGQLSLLDVLDTERSLIAFERLSAKLVIIRNKAVADLEQVVASEIAIDR
jgi:outer membrane protein TolC